jgi:hypothetical protein
MNRNIFLIIILFTISFGTGLYGIIPGGHINNCSNISVQDSIKERQVLYNGTIWTNRYHRINGDQFLFSGLFIPATVSKNGKTFKNVRIKYDIYADEIITPVNSEDILQLNKEMIDSFTLSFENKIYKFTNIQADTLKGFKGYVNVLYIGKSALYLKYKKTITPAVTFQSDGAFNQTDQIYFKKGNSIYPLKNIDDLFKILTTQKDQIKNFIKKNKLKVSKKIPESFIPVIRYYDSISQ